MTATSLGRPGVLPRLARGLTRRPLLVALALIAPALILRVVTGIWPFFDTLWISFHESSPTLPTDRWVGLDNYTELASNPIVQDTVFFTAFYTIVSTILELAVGLGIALLLNARFRITKLARSINLIPWAIPVVITGIAFRFGFDSATGPFAELIAKTTGIDPDWLLESWPARAAIIMTNVWRNAPFVAILVLAALQTIPDELYEAARVDGARRWYTFRRITLPLVTPVLITLGVFFLIWQIATFDLVLSMTGGGPGHATQVLGYQAYTQAFQGLDFGSGAALGMMLFALVAIFGIVGGLALRRAEARL